MGRSAQWAQILTSYPDMKDNVSGNDGSNANDTYYKNGPSCTGWNGTDFYDGGGGAGGYWGEEGKINILTNNGRYNGSLSTSTVDNAQSETGGIITTGVSGDRYRIFDKIN